MDTKYLVLVAGLVVTAFIAIMGLGSEGNTVVEKIVGAAAGPEHTERQYFKDSVVIGGRTFATTSQGATTYNAADIANSKVVLHKATAALTATLPTKTNLNAAGFLPGVGDTHTMFVYASTTLITLAGNTGVRLDSASTTNNINAAGSARLDFIRLPATEDFDIEVMMTTGE